MRLLLAVLAAALLAPFCRAQAGAVAGIDTRLLERKIHSELSAASASRALYFIFMDGKCAAGRVFDFGRVGAEKSLAETFPLGENSAALLSLMALNMAESGAADTRGDASDFFSNLRSARGKVRGANIENMLSQTAGFPYLADKIPQDSTPDEFFGALAQMYFSPPDPRLFQPSIASVAAAGYALAYAYNPASRDLKKTFAAVCRKFLFAPLGIEKPKFRHFDKWAFPAVCFCLAPDDIAKWLSCETSPKPPISTASALAERRGGAAQAASRGWRAARVGGAARGAFAQNNFAIIYNADGGARAAVAVFAAGGDAQKLKKSVARLAEFVNNQIKQ